MENILDFINNVDSHVCFSSWEKLETPFEVKLEDFLRFAESDLNSNKEGGLVNCLSNVKRAMDCQLESLFFAFGVYKRVKKQKLKFPEKMRWLTDLNIIAPKILRKINKNRNLLEHDFKKPKREEIEDSLDAVTLFVAYVKRFSDKSISDIEVIPNDEEKDRRWLNIKFDYMKGTFRIRLMKSNLEKKVIGELIEEAKVSYQNDRTYLKILHFFLEKTSQYFV